MPPNFIQSGAGGGVSIADVAQVLVDALGTLETRLSRDPVSVPVEPGSVRKYLAAHYDLECEHPIGELSSEIFEILYRGIVHPNRPCHFGLFVPSVRPAGVVADTLAALLNPQVGAWWYAPAASEIEDFILDACAAKVGFHPWVRSAHFTSGGSEANATAVVLALTRSFPEYATAGLALAKERPIFYVSEQAHDSFVKIAHMTGIGRSALRRVRTDGALRMDVDDLRRQYERDVHGGARPFLVVATGGTTASGAFDPLPEVAAVARETGLWFHVDAAWDGFALLLDELRSHMAGINEADSVTWDAHKVFPVPMGAGMFFARSHSGSQAFGVEAGYLPCQRQGTVDLYQHSMQWSRRFIGLKVFLTLAEMGWVGIVSLLREQMALGNTLREELLRAGFSVVNDSPLPLACFSHPAILAGKTDADRVVATVVTRGHAWLSSVRLSRDKPKAIRACITNHRTSSEDIKLAVSEVAHALST